LLFEFAFDGLILSFTRNAGDQALSRSQTLYRRK
jgi:hypothetical protein